MVTTGYWSKFISQRISRRRALAATAAGVGAAVIAACGGDETAGPAKDTSGLLSQIGDTSKRARRGGVLKTLHHQDVPTFDPMITSLPNQVPIQSFYTRFTRVKPGILEPSSGEIVGDQAESWEFSPDKLQITFKLRPNSYLDPRPLTKGRLFDAQDALFSWQRLGSVATVRFDYVNALNPDAPILSMSAPDSQTVVMKLKAPQASVPAMLGSTVAGAFWLLPREADGGFDPRNAAFGAGAFYLHEWVPSTRMIFKRNPGYWDKELPYVDTIELPIISEYAQQISQFMAGNIYLATGSAPIRREDLIPTKQRQPELMLLPTPVESESTRCMYGMRPGSKAPFKDERVRQAWSMSWDRDLYIDTVYNVSKFEAEGLPVETRWSSSAVPATVYDGWWLDPKSKEFGPNAKYFRNNPTEVKQLLSAAGYPNGLDTQAYYATTGEQGRDFANHIQILLGMAADAGLRIETVPIQFQQYWVPRIRDVQPKGDFDGISFRPNSGFPDPGETLFGQYHPSGQQQWGWDSKGVGLTGEGDPVLTDLVVKMRSEFDDKKRKALALELQRHDAAKQYYTYFPGGASGFALYWPVVGNAEVFQGGTIPNFNYWIDDSKAPLKS